MLVDSHCHLDFPGLVDDLDGVAERASAAGVGTMLTISTRLSTFDRVLGIARRRDDIWCSVGIHPHEAARESAVTVDELVALTADDTVVGIGETGLDYFYERSPRDVQQSQFRTHIGAARETGLPLIVHTRDADGDTMGILADEMATGPFSGLIHCFSSGRELAEKALELGLYISVSGIVTFKKTDALREILRGVPLDRLLVETDAPYLAPVPRRGKPNEPAYIAYTANVLAEIKDVSPAELAEATTANFFRLFDKARRPAQCA